MSKKLETLKKQLEELTLKKDQLHENLNNELYPVIEKKAVKEKDVLYILSKIDWQGKEAFGVVRINELMRDSFIKDQSVKNGEKDILQLRTTEMNALYYLLLRVKSNSRTDAEIYVKSVWPIIHNLEEQIVKSKSKYDESIKPILEEIEKLEKEIDALTIDSDKDAKEVLEATE
jgi:hypothetical protein